MVDCRASTFKISRFRPVQDRLLVWIIDRPILGATISESPGHDWWHVYRVWKMAERIAKEESADTFVVKLAALLHDIADWKCYDGDDNVGPRAARKVLSKQGVSAEIVNHVCEIIETAPFKGADVKTKMRTLEGKIVQDADRLDAIGTIGIARAFIFKVLSYLSRILFDNSFFFHPITLPYRTSGIFSITLFTYCLRFSRSLCLHLINVTFSPVSASFLICINFYMRAVGITGGFGS